MADLAWQAMAGWGLGLAILGACIGSFTAALVTRWPEGRSIVRGRSACDACGAPIGARDLVPLMSAVWLRGRCRACDAAIPAVHWQVELVGAWIGGAAGLVAPGPVAITGALFGWLLLALASLDVIAWWLPDRLTTTLAAAGLVLGQGGFSDRAAGGIAGLAVLWLVARGYRMWRGREGLGDGDPKMLGAIGCWLGWTMLPAVLVLAGIAGLGWVAALRLAGRPVSGTTALPFGALMAVAAYPAWLAMVAVSR